MVVFRVPASDRGDVERPLHDFSVPPSTEDLTDPIESNSATCGNDPKQCTHSFTLKRVAITFSATSIVDVIIKYTVNSLATVINFNQLLLPSAVLLI